MPLPVNTVVYSLTVLSVVHRFLTFYARGQTGQQLLLGAYSALSKQIGLGKVKMYNRHEMLDLVKVDGHAKGIIVRNMTTGEVSRTPVMRSFLLRAVMVTSNSFSDEWQGCNVTAATAHTSAVQVWLIPVTRKFIYLHSRSRRQTIEANTYV